MVCEKRWWRQLHGSRQSIMSADFHTHSLYFQVICFACPWIAVCSCFLGHDYLWRMDLYSFFMLCCSSLKLFYDSIYNKKAWPIKVFHLLYYTPVILSRWKIHAGPLLYRPQLDRNTFDWTETSLPKYLIILCCT